MLIVGCVILLPTYFSFFFEGAGTHARVRPVSREEAVGAGLPPGALTTFAGPDPVLLKFFNRSELWPSIDVSMISIYTGAAVLAFGVLALACKPREPWRWWLAGIGAFALVCALGSILPFRGWLYDWFVPLRFIKRAVVFRPYYLFTACVLALYGTRDFADDAIAGRVRRRAAVVFGAVALCAMAVVIAAAFSQWSTSVPRELRSAAWAQAAVVWFGIAAVGISLRHWPDKPIGNRFALAVLAISACDAFLTAALSMPTMLRIATAQRWDTLDYKHSSNLDITSRGLYRAQESVRETPLGKIIWEMIS